MKPTLAVCLLARVTVLGGAAAEGPGVARARVRVCTAGPILGPFGAPGSVPSTVLLGLGDMEGGQEAVLALTGALGQALARCPWLRGSGCVL